MKTIINRKTIVLNLILGLILVSSCSSNDDTSQTQEDQTVAIPDANFEQALVDANIDTNGLNSNILKTDAEAITVLNVADKNIASLQGIEAFINLTGLICTNNQLTTINLNENTALLDLDCSRNLLTTLDVSNNTALEYLVCDHNQLSTLDFSINVALEELYCDDNEIIDLDLSLCTSLTKLHVENNNLTSLNMKNGNNTNVTFFNTRNNPELNCIQVDDQAYSATNWFDYDTQTSFRNDCSDVIIPDTNFEQALIDEGYDTNGLNGSITLADAEAVINLNINNKNISDLSGIESFVNLEILSVNQNHLTSIDLSSNIALTQLHCFLNELSALDLTNNISLQTLDVKFNNLTNINFGNNTALYEVSCNNNNLTTLDFSANTALNRLDAQNNLLTSLNVQNGNNSNFIDFHVRYNDDLYCIKVDNAEYSTQNWDNVSPLVEFSEEDCDN